LCICHKTAAPKGAEPPAALAYSPREGSLMKTTSLSIPALLALALKSARSAPALEEAMAAYDRGNYLEAQCLLLLAAHWGNAHAQELLGFMYAIGPALYPGTWRSLGAARNWFERAARGKE
jgi:TPR repeat protein